MRSEILACDLCGLSVDIPISPYMGPNPAPVGWVHLSLSTTSNEPLRQAPAVMIPRKGAEAMAEAFGVDDAGKAALLKAFEEDQKTIAGIGMLGMPHVPHDVRVDKDFCPTCMESRSGEILAALQERSGHGEA